MPRTRDAQSGDTAESAPAVRRTLRVIELLSRHPEGVRMTDVATELGLPKSSTLLLLSAITDMGWAAKESTGNYVIGIRTWQIGQQYLQARTLAERAQPLMDGVRDQLNETVRLAALDGWQNVYLTNSKGGQALALETPTGVRLPAYATGLGKVLLAALEPAEVRRRLDGVDFEPFTEHTVSGVEELLKELAVIRRRGWGGDDEEYVQGVQCVAVPVRDHHDQVAASMSVSVPTIRFGKERRRAALEALLHAASDLSISLGASVPPPSTEI